MQACLISTADVNPLCPQVRKGREDGTRGLRVCRAGNATTRMAAILPMSRWANTGLVDQRAGTELGPRDWLRGTSGSPTEALLIREVSSGQHSLIDVFLSCYNQTRRRIPGDVKDSNSSSQNRPAHTAPSVV